MEKPLNDDTDDYTTQLEEYCDFLEETLEKQKERTDYWCSAAMEARAYNKELQKERIKLRKERAL